ncbi:MAG TPA: hypothetical protein VFR58_11195 [Flavisolibacter sp.]|nr:hypothetical protein [Flavisolibacter sp.]
MKSYLFPILLLLMATAGNTQSVYQLSVKDIDGNPINLNAYAGKKILFYLLPLSASDSGFLQLQAFKSRYLDTVQVIGVPSIEDGFQQSSGAASLKALYSNLGIIITQGMHTRKSSGANQSELMQWLTNKSKNLHFDMDALGIGHKFFVSGTGRAFAVMPPQVPLTAPLFDRIVRSPN